MDCGTPLPSHGGCLCTGGAKGVGCEIWTRFDEGDNGGEIISWLRVLEALEVERSASPLTKADDEISARIVWSSGVRLLLLSDAGVPESDVVEVDVVAVASGVSEDELRNDADVDG